MILTVARRNIWRNKKRTIITVASIFFALFFALMMRSIQIGTFAKIADDVISSYSGHIQLHKKGYWNEKIIDNVFDRNLDLENQITHLKQVKAVVPRLESFALASVGDISKACMVSGIVPKQENEMTKIKTKLVKGKYLAKNDNGAIIGDELAKFLKLNINDTIVLIGQGYHALSAAGKYPVKGIIHLPSPELNRRIVYITLNQAQELYSTENRLTALSILLNSNKDIEDVKAEIKRNIKKDEYEVMDWTELLFELKQLIDSKQSSSLIMLGLLYMIVGFGVFGTVVMMTAERRREYGLLVSLGMKKIRLISIVFLETVFLGILGILSGFMASLPIIFYFNENPILLTGNAAKTYEDLGFDPVMVFSDDSGFMISQIIIVLFIILISSIYPVIKIVKLKPMEALRR